MIKLHHAPWSRSVRIVWLLEELGLPYELRSAPLEPPAPKPFAQKTPFGKVPAIEDDGIAMFESGAILEYVLERYGGGRLAPPRESPLRGPFLQWVHFADSTAFAGLGNIAWHTQFKQDAEQLHEAIADYRAWAEAALTTLETALVGKDFILGEEFSGADVMLGYTLLVARSFGVLTADAHPNVERYLGRLTARPALRKALRAGLPAEART
jgi:glutathione S-transferase